MLIDICRIQNLLLLIHSSTVFLFSQTASEEVVIGKPNTSGSSPKKKWRRKEVSSSSDSEVNDSVFEDHPNCNRPEIVSACPDNSSVEVLHVDKEIDILAKLRCTVQVDKNTRDFLGKVLTSVHCESTNLSSRNRRKNDDESMTDSVTSDVQPCRINFSPSLVSVPTGCSPNSSSISSLNCKQEKLTKEGWKNLNLLTTTMMNFANTKLHEAELDDDSKELPNRPRERIHFSTPEVEEKYRKIVQELTRQDKISSYYKGAASSCTPSPSKKRKYPSEIFIEPPEVPEKTDTEIEATLGPFPAPDSNLFKGMSFVFTCFIVRETSSILINWRRLRKLRTLKTKNSGPENPS